MAIRELRDPVEARQYLLQSLLLARGEPLDAPAVAGFLRWTRLLLSEGIAAPPPAFVLDAARLALRSAQPLAASAVPSPAGVPPALLRGYEDYVLGRLATDLAFERAADAVLRYRHHDSDRAVAYLIRQIGDRAGLPQIALGLGLLRELTKQSPDTLIREAWRDNQAGVLDDQVLRDHHAVVAAVREAGELVGPEDLFELERGTALAEFGQRVALRQLIQTREELQRAVQRPLAAAPRHFYSVATRQVQEDVYPVGGFSSLSNKGTLESLLRTELAYLDDDQRPDLFDVKFVRDELLYYARDENVFLRRRLKLVFLLTPQLAQIRFKDPTLPCQRIVLLLAVVVSVIEQLTEWLGDYALQFHLHWLTDHSGTTPLADERELLNMVLGDERENQLVVEQTLPESASLQACYEHARGSHVACLPFTASTSLGDWEFPSCVQFHVDGQSLVIRAREGRPEMVESGTSPMTWPGWCEALQALLRQLV